MNVQAKQIERFAAAENSAGTVVRTEAAVVVDGVYKNFVGAGLAERLIAMRIEVAGNTCEQSCSERHLIRRYCSGPNSESHSTTALDDRTHNQRPS